MDACVYLRPADAEYEYAGIEYQPELDSSIILNSDGSSQTLSDGCSIRSGR